MFRPQTKYILLIGLLFGSTVLAQTKVKLADKPLYVTDLANVVGAQHERSLGALIRELNQKLGIEYVVLTIPSTNGVPIEQYGVQVAHDKWKLGKDKGTYGFLFVLAVQDRRYTFQVGYDLEGFITDRYCGQIGRDVLVPYLKRNQYSEGIYQANVQVMRRIASEADVTLTGMPNVPRGPQPVRRGRGRSGARFLVFLILMILFMGGMGGGMRRGMGGWLFWPMFFGGFGGRGGYGRSGSYGGGMFGGSSGGFGGGFGGSFGGFGGGGGGGFGGGGASGGW